LPYESGLVVAQILSVILRSYWIVLVMDIFTRRIIGFGIGPTWIDGMSACRMFNAATTGQCKPKYLNTRSRSAFPLSPLARQPARDRGRRDQVGSIRSGLASVC
jgi:hypothetical protein